MKHRHLLIFFFAALIGAVTVRTMQLYFVIDSTTRFFKNSYESVGVMMSAGLVVLVAISGILGFFNDQRPKGIPKTSLILAASMFLVGVSNIIEPIFNPTSSSIPLLLSALNTILLEAAGLSFCYLAVCMFLVKPVRYQLMIVPVVLWIVRLMVTFMSYTGTSNISDNLYDVAMIGATLVFLLSQAKLLCGVKSGRYSFNVLAFGLMATMLIAICILPPIIVAFLGNAQFIHSTVDSITTHFFMGAYIIIYLFCTPYAKRSDKN